ncbi:MAG: hypothetical protein RLZ10_57 [Bacteroidota bacterium]|jgi:hypothetical protein
MSRFKRISDEIPQSIDQALFKTAGQKSNEVDTRREAMAREMSGYNTESAKKVQEKAWERISTASILNEQKFFVEDENLSNLRPEDVSLSGIRRAGYDTDNVSTSMRPSPSDMFNDPITAAMRGASIWGDLEEVNEILMEMADKDNQNFDKTSAREKQQSRIANWEQEKLEEMGGLRNKAFATNRGHQIIKAHHETGVAGRNNIHDYSFLNEAEEQRKALAEANRNRKLAIKDHSVKSREEKHEEWQSTRVANNVSKFQDVKNNWIDEFDRLVRG